jgi:hypothetical protein
LEKKKSELFPTGSKLPPAPLHSDPLKTARNGSSLVEWSGRRKPNSDKEELGAQWTVGSETELFRCKGQEGDMRRLFGHLVGDEKHDREKLTIDGGHCSRDP